MKKLFINAFKLTFDFQALDADFSFFAFSKPRKRYGYPDLNVLDGLMQEESGAGLRAALFEFRGDAFLMFAERKDSYDVQRALLSSNDQFKTNLHLERITAAEIPDHYLFQLLLNASVPRDREAPLAQHLSGSLFLTHFTPPFLQRRKGYLSAVRVVVKKGGVLSLDVKTFTSLKNGRLFRDKAGMLSAEISKKMSRRPKYVLDPATKTLSRCFETKDIPKENLYLLKKPAMDPGKVIIPYCDLRPREYARTKLGLWNRFFWEYFQPACGKYVQVEQRQMPGWRQSRVFEQAEWKEQLPFETVALAPERGLEAEAQTVRACLENEFGLQVLLQDSPPCGTPILHLVREKEFYSFEPDKDPYGKFGKELPVQHLTAESIGNKPKAVVEKCLKELGIKQDIHTGQLHLFDWRERIQASGDWFFMLPEKGENGNSPDVFYTMRIDPAGHFQFNRTVRGEGADPVCHEMQYQLYRFQERDEEVNVQGLLRDDRGNINFILRTDLQASFDLENLHQYLMSGNELTNATAVRKDLLSFFDRFLERHRGERPLSALEELKRWTAGQTGAAIPLRECSDRLHGRIRGERMLQFALNFREQFGYWLKPVFKNAYMRRYFDSMVDIHVANINEEVYFWSGFQSKGLNGNFHRTHQIRKLTPAAGSEVIFEPIAALLDVDFVRVNAPTVIPFPFKYLREYERGKRSDNRD